MVRASHIRICIFTLVVVASAILVSSWGPRQRQLISRSKGIEVSVELARATSNECVVKVTASNKGPTSLTIAEEDMPWYPIGDSFTIGLIRRDFFKTPINRSPYIMDPVVGLVTLHPGQTISREVSLDWYYRDLLSALLDGDVTMLWVYRSRPLGTNEPEACVGYLEIPRVREKGRAKSIEAPGRTGALIDAFEEDTH